MADLKVIPTKTARFTQVVQRAGKPSVHLSFVPPAKDPELQKLIKLNRVMSVHRGGRGGGADFGTVGLREEKGSQLWIFPKSLKAFTDRRIVGINYDLLDEDFSLGMDPKAEAKAKAVAAKAEKREEKEAREARKKADREKNTPDPGGEADDDQPEEREKPVVKKKAVRSRTKPGVRATDVVATPSSASASLEREDIVIHLRSIQRNLARGRTKQAEEAIEDLISQLAP